MSIDGQLQQQQQQQQEKQHASSSSSSSSPKHQSSPPIVNNEEDHRTSRENEERHLRHVVISDVRSEMQQKHPQQKLWYNRGRNFARTAVGVVQPIFSSATSVFATTATVPKSQPPFSPPKRSSSSFSSTKKNQAKNNSLRQKTRRFRSKSASQGIIWVLVFPICIILIVLLHRTESYELDDPTIERLVCVRLSRIISRLGLNIPTSSVTSRSRSVGRQRENQHHGDTSNHTPILLQSLALLNEDRRQRGEEPITLDSLVAFQRVLSDRSLWVGLAERYRLYEQEQQQQQRWEGTIGDLNRLRSDEEIERQRRHQQLSTKATLEEKCPLWTLDTMNIPLHEEECIICLSTFEKNDKLRTLPCQHSFHGRCIDVWMDRSSQCPMCKQSIL